MRERSLPGSYFRDLLLVAVDGSTLALQDTAMNSAEFGRSTNQNGDGAWPLARFVALVECGTHLIFGARIGAYKDSEITLAKDLAGALGPGMLFMADRLFPGYELWVLPKPAAAADEAPNDESSRSGGPNSRSESKAPNPPPENAIPPS
jgi:hypothetical protein